MHLRLRERHWLRRRGPIYRAGADRPVPAATTATTRSPIPDVLLIRLLSLWGWRLRILLLLVLLLRRNIIIPAARARRAAVLRHRLLSLQSLLLLWLWLHAVAHLLWRVIYL